MATPTSSKTIGFYVLLAASILPFTGGLTARAQDAAGTTPPELRDFRLDPPPRETAPQPEVPGPEVRSPQQVPPSRQAPATPPEIITPAPVNRQPSSTAPEPAPADPVSSENGPSGNNPSERNRQDVLAEPSTAPVPGAAPASVDVAPDEATDQPRNLAPAPSASSGISDLGIAALAGILLAIGALGLVLWRRRAKAASAPVTQPLPRKDPLNARPADAGTRPAPTAPPPVPPSVVLRAPAAAPRLVSMEFVPENAVVSFTSLNIQGKLHIANPGNAATDELALRTVLISASSDQQGQMDNFFKDPGQNAAMPLVAIEAGDSITVPLKIGVSLSALQAFSLQEKTMLAPILLAKLVAPSQDGTEQEIVRLVCMIGREANPPRAKMGPLRLDQGPRSFDHLGQRALVS